MHLKTLSYKVLGRIFNRSFSSSLCARHAAAAATGCSDPQVNYSTWTPRYTEQGEAGSSRVVDLRSDVAAKPGLAMRRAMAEAEHEGDGLGEDPIVHGSEAFCFHSVVYS